MAQERACTTCYDLEACDMSIEWDSLINSVKDGCAACCMLKEGVCSLTKWNESPLRLNLVIDMSLFVYTESRTGKDEEIFEFFTLPGKPVTWRAIGPARLVSTNSSSDECISLVSRWLSGCLSSHSDCRRTGVPMLPTRVIDVGSSESEIKLFVNSSNKKAEYAALSHCWGLGHPIVLTKRTIEAMQERIILDDESRTFRDAIDVTRRLGIPYLWIDSLCILQDKDDLSDWEREAPKMSDIYNSATVTISAASSLDTSGGLFPQEDDRQSRHKSTKLASTSPEGEPSNVFVRARSKEHFCTSDNVHASLHPEEPNLRTRGWVLQEDSLSPRMLHFRKEELSWTCSTYSRCECRIRPAMPLPHPFRGQIGTIQVTPEHTMTLDRQWPSIVMEYTRRKLTKDSDRVAALSGLAKYMEGQTTDTYYCGVWYEDMAYQLLWYVDRQDCPQGVQRRFKSPYAQSWSWMSVPGPISYYTRFPAGIAPSHPAMRSHDAVIPLAKVLNVGRLPFNWDNLVGKLLLCPAALLALVMRVEYDPRTKAWRALDSVQDFDPSNLRINIDTIDDELLLEIGIPAQYIFILAGHWVGQGMTFMPMQAVCIIARRLPPQKQFLVDTAIAFQLRMAAQLRQAPGDDMIFPDLEHSFERIGLARGAGSIDAWKRANLMGLTFLF